MSTTPYQDRPQWQLSNTALSNAGALRLRTAFAQYTFGTKQYCEDCGCLWQNDPQFPAHANRWFHTCPGDKPGGPVLQRYTDGTFVSDNRDLRPNANQAETMEETPARQLVAA